MYAIRSYYGMQVEIIGEHNLLAGRSNLVDGQIVGGIDFQNSLTPHDGELLHI